jgi:hypothetical protein
MDSEEQAGVNVSRIEAAAMIQGEEFTKAQHQLAALDLAVLEAGLADAQIEGKRTGDLKLRIGLKRKEVATWAGDEELAASIGQDEGEDEGE